MAHIYADFSFDMTDFDLNRSVRGAVGSCFYDDDPFTIDGEVYTDDFEIYWNYRANFYSTAIVGEELDADDIEVFDGTATGFFEFFWDYQDATWRYYIGMNNISVAATSIFDAAATEAVDDDYGFLRQALAGDDKFLLSNQHDIVFGYGGQDIMRGHEGRDVLKGGDGKDTLRGGADGDRLFGERGDDRLFGGVGADFLKGGAGQDELSGGGGPDRIEGGKGDDSMTGGDGKDAFVFRAGSGVDTIWDFQWDPDTLLLDDALWSGDLATSEIVNTFGFVDKRGVGLDFGTDEIVLAGFQGADDVLLGNLEGEITVI